MSRQVFSITEVLGLYGVNQRDAARLLGVSQPTISRLANKPWNELDRGLIVRLLEGIAEEDGSVEFTVIGARGDKVARVYYKDTQTAGVIFRPFRPNEC